MSNIDSSCEATVTGRLSSVFSKYGFWFDTLVSMDMWADNTRIEKPDQNCFIEYGQSTANKFELMQCLAYTKNQWDWYKRCHAIVELHTKK